MPLYEHVFMARQDLSQQQVDELTAQYKGVIEQLGGTVAKVEYWGVKSLTYRIRKNRKAHFTLMNLEAPPAAVAEVERQEHISEDVLRAMTVRVGSWLNERLGAVYLACAANALARTASSVVIGVNALGSILRCTSTGKPEFCAASNALGKSAVFSTVTPKPPNARA